MEAGLVSEGYAVMEIGLVSEGLIADFFCFLTKSQSQARLGLRIYSFVA